METIIVPYDKNMPPEPEGEVIDGSTWYFPVGYIAKYEELLVARGLRKRNNPSLTKKLAAANLAEQLTVQKLSSSYYINTDYHGIDDQQNTNECINNFVEWLISRISVMPFAKIDGTQFNRGERLEIQKCKANITRRINVVLGESDRTPDVHKEIMREILIRMEPKFQYIIGNMVQGSAGQNESFRSMPKVYERMLLHDLIRCIHKLKAEWGLSDEEIYDAVRVRSTFEPEKKPIAPVQEKPRERFTNDTREFFNDNPDLQALVDSVSISPAVDDLSELFKNDEVDVVDIMKSYGHKEGELLAASEGRRLVYEAIIILIENHSAVQEKQFPDRRLKWVGNLLDESKKSPAKVLKEFYGRISGIKILKIPTNPEVLSQFGISEEKQKKIDKADTYALQFTLKSTGKKPVTHLIPVCIASGKPLGDGPIRVNQIAITVRSEYMNQLGIQISALSALKAREQIPVFRG